MWLPNATTRLLDAREMDLDWFEAKKFSAAGLRRPDEIQVVAVPAGASARRSFQRRARFAWTIKRLGVSTSVRIVAKARPPATEEASWVHH